jgi:polysaccharide deacetylase 2 family uncharacterized protein YibQ
VRRLAGAFSFQLLLFLAFIVSSELNRVLKPKQRKKPRFTRSGVNAGQITLGLALSALLCASVYTALAPGNLGKASTGSSVDEALLAKNAQSPPVQPNVQDTIESGNFDSALSGTSGANIRRTQFTDGKEVRVYSPKDRDGSGAVLLSGQRFGQDPMSATRPNDDLIEMSEFGTLPTIGSDGLRPIEQYARPWSGARGTRIAIVVGGLGLSQTGSQKAIATLPSEVTLGFAASGNSLQRWMQEARREGHEILLQVPMQAFGENGGTGKLMTNAAADANLAVLQRSMAKITNYTGIMNHLGGQFLASEAALSPVLDDIAGRGLLFLDDGTSAQSKVSEVARKGSYPVAFGDMVLDSELEEGAILRRLDDLERLARRNGTAIATASAFDETISAVSKWVNEAQGRGIEIVGVASLISDRQ